ncbi:universal stress protein [Actinorhabdospora filicis]|uniref:Universal stress protein n=1 Tax=Actinorhabdospora filicis TaxID=1785913 RepID=A0A9W6SIJ9_9ACTN|nr:universal stress protein [Actinorhabdospora filicis]GLZ77740.1 universal stress protein [Actinorhabdospora filicis]
MTLTRSGPVTVGIDGSGDALEAVEFAARAAVSHDRRLRIVHAYIWPLMRTPVGVSGMRDQAEQWLRDAAAHATASAPGVTSDTEIVTGSAGAVLVAESRACALLVLGSRGLGGFGGLLLGSVGTQLASHAEAPVVIVRSGGTPGGPVVVGVDGSEPAEEAVGLAFDMAAASGVGVLAVHADDGDVSNYDRHLLAESLGGYAGRYPDVPVEARHASGRAAQALVECSAGASLLVVGSRGRGGFKGLLLGSVSQAAVTHASCPVMVVRA